MLKSDSDMMPNAQELPSAFGEPEIKAFTLSVNNI